MNTESTRAGTRKPGSLGEAFLANWVPLSLIGAGVAWLLASNTGVAVRVVQDKRGKVVRPQIAQIGGDIGFAGAAKQESDTSRSQHILGPSGESAISSGDADRTDGWVHQAAGAARGAISSVREAGSAVLDRAGQYTDYVSNAGDLARRASDPWLVGVFGLIAGALLAAVLPPTEIEQELIADTRDELRSKAAEIGHEAAVRVRELAESATRTSRGYSAEA